MTPTEPTGPATAGQALGQPFSATRRDEGTAPRVTEQIVVPPELFHDIVDFANSRSWLPDTPWCAALLLLMGYWTGNRDNGLMERASTGGPRLTTTCRWNSRDDLKATAWMQRVDDQRRAALTSGFDAREALPDEVHPLWLGSADSGVEGTNSRLALCLRGGASASLTLDGSAELLDPMQARALLRCAVQAVSQLNARRDAPLHEIDLLGPGDRRLLFQEWNPPLAPIPRSATVHGVFKIQADTRGEAIALAFRGAHMSYAELDFRSDQFALQLQRVGVVAGGTVGVALPRGMDSIVVLLGILKAGAAYLPVEKSYPSQRLHFMLGDAAAALVVTHSNYRSAFGDDIPILLIDSPPASVVASATAATADADALAYVMYTSGSTGTPKGIEICHRSILRLVVNSRFMALSDNEAVMHAAPLGFDASTLEIWGPLLNGGRCVLHDEDLPTAAGLGRTIREEGVTAAWLTAALFNAVVDDNPAQLVGLRQLLIGGEALSASHVRRAQETLPDLALINGYGPTECTTFATTYRIPSPLPAEVRSIPIGRPINDTQVYILGSDRRPLPVGLVGELYIGGHGLARGYLKRPELTSERFVPNPFGADGERLYRTGDLVRYLPDGNLEFIGRADAQIKVRGFRIEPGEIEAALGGLTGIKTSVVVADKDKAGNARLVAYVVSDTNSRMPVAELRARLSDRLPDFMVPAAFVWLEALPITLNGKLDRRALPKPASQRPDLVEPFQQPVSPNELRVCAAFADALDIDTVGRNDNFFDLGGNSLLVLQVLADLGRNSPQRISTNAFFRDPTPAALARALSTDTPDLTLDARRLPRNPAIHPRVDHEPVAVIALAGRFPGARDVEQFWNNLCAGRDSVTRFEDSGLDPSLPSSLTHDACYVKARGVIDDVEMFDAAFFGISPREAELMDPQQRVFMELCWECLERGGHSPDSGERPIGVFAGMNNATYFQRHLAARPDLVEKLGEFQVMLANEKDYIATRIANRLNLTGPAVSVHTACSTSLVAIAQAVVSLRAGQCDMALAGGASITCPPRSGYLYQDGAMLSPDGCTRSFDADAGGTVFSDGAAVVLLKRLSDAQAEGNTVLAVIRGVAINNDGRNKASFTAPSVDGQAAVIAAAHADAGVDARTITYVETHGTATPLGDPAEVEGLTRAFRRATDERGYCRIGSLKSNVGHMVIAAGAGGVIKTALALATEQLPPSIHFERANPKIDFANSPFVVTDRLTPWPRSASPRRAGVSSFGVGGTNAHVVLEEAPPAPASSASIGPQLLQLSARSADVLNRMSEQLAAFLDADPNVNLADVAHTLKVGRSHFVQRLCVVAETTQQASRALRERTNALRVSRSVGAAVPSVVWLFPGQGAQYAGMGRGLHGSDTSFRSAFDDCVMALQPSLPFDLRARMFDGATGELEATEVTQPATFCLEYALARTWLARGAQPAALIGHSIGEFSAAVVAGVMSLRDAAGLVALRGSMMQRLPRGSMVSLRMSADRLESLMPPGLSLAAENGPGACVVAGPTDLVVAWQAQLEADGVAYRSLHTSHAFHSSMMDAAVAPFEAEVAKVRLSPPSIPIASTLTGTWLRDEDATSPRYWSRHLRETVRFSAAVRAALDRFDAAFLEVGPRGALATLARQHVRPGASSTVAVTSFADTPDAEVAQMLLAQGQLWSMGIELPASAASPSLGRRRIRLPTYAFDRKRFWVDALPRGAATSAPATEGDLASLPGTPDAVPDEPQPAADPARSEMPHATPMPTGDNLTARQHQLDARLRALFEDVAGTDLAGADAQAAFVELGLDSLTLTQAALQVKKHFGVAITFRQLMEQYRSFESLAGYLDAALPPDPARATPGAAMPVSAPAAPRPAASQPVLAAASGADASLLQQVIAQQMQLMAQQLALLAGAPGSAAPTLPSSIPNPTIAAPAPTTATASATATADARGGAMRYDVKKAFGAIARIHTQSSELTQRQRARLDAFVRRYVERTAKSKDYTVRHRPHLADPRVVNGFRPMTKEIAYQIVMERSEGSRMWDIDGNEYIDVLSGFGMNLFGWQPDFVQEAVRRQLDAGYEIGPQHPLAGEVAALVCELTGCERAGLCNTGSEAVMAAVRIARTVSGRNTLVLFTGSYHGTFDEVLVRAGRGGKGIPAAPGIMAGVFGDVRVLDYGTPEALDFIRSHADDLAAVLVEPVQSRRPDFQPREFLQQVRAITEQSGTCLIFDEVITGFRSHLGGTQALFGVRADLACYGKVIGGGFPVGVIAGKRAYMDALDGGAWQFGDDSIPTVGVTYFAGTFVRHPLALAAAKASLEHLKREGPALQMGLNEVTAAMADELSAFCREVGAPLEIRHFASLWRVNWLEDHPLQDLLFAMMRSRGVHILDNFPCFMTTAHTEADVQFVATAFKDSVRELQESEFLPRHKVPVAMVFDASKPPVPGARLGKDPDGRPAWYVSNPDLPGKYLKVSA